MTAGILAPAVVLSYFDMLQTGVVISLGAMAVSTPDTAGPIQHRRIAMSVCLAAIFFQALVTGFIAGNPLFLGIWIVCSCFFFSMLGIYGPRAGAIGIAALLIMILNMDHQHKGLEVIFNTLYILAGGIWYMVLSLVLYSVRPYKLAQQALGDAIQSTAKYLRIRGGFYETGVDPEDVYNKLFHEQVTVQEKQSLLNEILFKTPEIVKESSNMGRVLIMMHLDVTELYERLMTSYQDYSLLHGFFDGTEILAEIRALVIEAADELDEIGLSVQSGRTSLPRPHLWEHLEKVQEDYSKLRQTWLKPANIEGFISLRRILDNIQDIAARLQVLHQYTSYDKKIKKSRSHSFDYEQLVSHEEISVERFMDNLNFQSNLFRHSLRVSAAALIGYGSSFFFNFGHRYWILLTIVVILKPAYSLSKKRNADRLFGTVIGAVIGVLILYFIHNGTALLVIMILLMAATYSFIRTQYMLGVTVMTPYVILFLHLLSPSNFLSLLTDRILDTAIGSVIAFAASLFFVPAWERTAIRPNIIELLKNNRKYFERVTNILLGKSQGLELTMPQARKNALVALANLSDAFQRMLSEPRSQQNAVTSLKKFLVLNHMLISHTATLASYVQMRITGFESADLLPVQKDILLYMENAASTIAEEQDQPKLPDNKQALFALNEKSRKLLEIRRTEIESGRLETSTRQQLLNQKSVADQFNIIHKIVSDLNKAAVELEKQV
jgi:uncharacterized membrane protein YccC